MFLTQQNDDYGTILATLYSINRDIWGHGFGFEQVLADATDHRIREYQGKFDFYLTESRQTIEVKTYFGTDETKIQAKAHQICEQVKKYEEQIGQNLEETLAVNRNDEDRKTNIVVVVQNDNIRLQFQQAFQNVFQEKILFSNLNLNTNNLNKLFGSDMFESHDNKRKIVILTAEECRNNYQQDDEKLKQLTPSQSEINRIRIMDEYTQKIEVIRKILNEIDEGHDTLNELSITSLDDNKQNEFKSRLLDFKSTIQSYRGTFANLELTNIDTSTLDNSNSINPLISELNQFQELVTNFRTDIRKTIKITKGLVEQAAASQNQAVHRTDLVEKETATKIQAVYREGARLAAEEEQVEPSPVVSALSSSAKSDQSPSIHPVQNIINEIHDHDNVEIQRYKNELLNVIDRLLIDRRNHSFVDTLYKKKILTKFVNAINGTGNIALKKKGLLNVKDIIQSSSPIQVKVKEINDQTQQLLEARTPLTARTPVNVIAGLDSTRPKPTPPATPSSISNNSPQRPPNKNIQKTPRYCSKLTLGGILVCVGIAVYNVRNVDWSKLNLMKMQITTDLPYAHVGVTDQNETYQSPEVIKLDIAIKKIIQDKEFQFDSQIIDELNQIIKSLEERKSSHEPNTIDQTEYQLGMIFEDFYERENDTKNLEKANSWYEKAHNHNNEKAILKLRDTAFRLSNIYFQMFQNEGNVNETYKQKVLKWLIEADYRGHNKAAYRLASIYYDSYQHYLDRDTLRTVMKWYDISHNQRNYKGAYELGIIYHDMYKIYKSSSNKLDGTYLKRALPLFKKAHDQGHNQATFMVGINYEEMYLINYKFSYIKEALQW